MNVVVPVKYRRPLNSQQIDVLVWLYKFRFSTGRHITEHLGRASYKGIQKKLQILEGQDFIGKRYDKSYKLLGRSAEYYLTPKGARQLERHRPDTTNQLVAKTLYKNKTVSREFITHCLHVVDTALQLQKIYGSRLKTFTRSSLVAYDYFPAWQPDLFLNLQIGNGQSRRQHYFLDIWDGTKPFFISVRKARNYLKYVAEGGWPTDQADFPAILAVCEDTKAQKKLNRQIKHALDDSYEDETVFATTTQQQLIRQSKVAERIWLKVGWDGNPEKATLGSLFGNP